MSSLPKNLELTEKETPNLYDSDSDMSDTERLISERRRLNTEYMEQIEKERQEMMEKVIEEKPESSGAKEMKETLTIENENDIEMKDVSTKSLEELEAERDAILQQVRNPEPPSSPAVLEGTKVPEFELPSRTISQENTDVFEKKKLDKVIDINGELTRLKTISESSTGESSPHSQVSST